MNVFISHSGDDTILKGINNILSTYSNINLLIAEHHKDYNNTISEKIKRMIQDSNICLFLLTKNGMYSGFVREEIGYSEDKKPGILVFEEGLKEKYGGFKYGCDYITLDPNEQNKAIEEIRDTLLKYWQKKVSKEKEIALKEIEIKENQFKKMITAFGILAGIIILQFFTSDK